MRPRIGVIGERVASTELYDEARFLGEGIAKLSGILICGGMGGVMEAACRGCMEAGGISIGILPGDSAQEANAYVTIPIVAGMGEGRNIIVVRSAQVVVAVGGSFGTLSEIALALRLAKPVIGIRTWTFSPGSPPTTPPRAPSGRPGSAGRDPIVRVAGAAQALALLPGLLNE